MSRTARRPKPVGPTSSRGVQLLEASGVRTQPPRGSEFIIPHAFLPVADSTITILTWNPDHWGGDQWWTDEVANFDPQDPTSDRWSTGSRSSGIAIGDSGILLRQGHERGIVGIGIFTSEIYQTTPRKRQIRQLRRNRMARDRSAQRAHPNRRVVDSFQAGNLYGWESR